MSLRTTYQGKSKRKNSTETAWSLACNKLNTASARRQLALAYTHNVMIRFSALLPIRTPFLMSAPPAPPGVSPVL